VQEPAKALRPGGTALPAVAEVPEEVGSLVRVIPESSSRMTTRSGVSGPWWNSTSTRAASASSAFQMHSARAARGLVFACRLRWSDRAATWKTCSPPAPSTRKLPLPRQRPTKKA
jgi:hypothetical protein